VFLGSDEHGHARFLTAEEDKLIDAEWKFVRFDQKDDVSVY